MATSRQKNATPPRGGNWSRLETPGDVRRFLRWLILQTKADLIDTKKAGVMGQLGLYLLKTLEVSDLATQIAEIEQRLERTQEPHAPHEPDNAYTTH